MPHDTSLDELHLESSWCTIGSFDGVHRGHQTLIAQFVEGAHQVGVPAVVVTFFPHPVRVVRGLQGPIYLNTPDERAALLLAMGVDRVVTLTFDEQLAALSAEDFMSRLVTHLGLRCLWVGHDFALGRGRKGDVAALRRLGMELNYQVRVVMPVVRGGEVVSSSQVRALIQQGAISQANDLLGRPYSVSGEVVRGNGRGHTLGFPTANLAVWPERVLPVGGVYATWAQIGELRCPAVTNIGQRPTFETAPVESRVETYLLDFNRDVYGQTVRLEFIEMLRREERFASPEALIQQITRDAHRTRGVLGDAG